MLPVSVSHVYLHLIDDDLDISQGPVLSLNATREVILSAGPFQTPHLRESSALLM